MKKILILVSTVILFFNCSNDTCGECSDLPKSFLFEIVDKNSGENLFTNGTYDSNQIEIMNSLSNSPASFSFIDTNNANLISIYGIGLLTEIVEIEINISGENIFNFYVNTERIQGDCCYSNIYNEIEVRNSDYQYNSEIEVYKILVE